MNHRRNASDVLCQSLIKNGVNVVFGLPGTQTVPLYESLRSSQLRTITAGSELSSLLMANGYYRASGKPGVAVTIGGPGFTMAMTGLAEARHDSAAILHIVCSSDKVPGKSFQFQELDVSGIARLVAKAVYQITSPREVHSIITKAYQESLHGEPAPVVVEISVSVLNHVADVSQLDSNVADQRAGMIDEAALDTLASKLRSSRKPMILVGQGAVGSADGVVQLAEVLNAVVVTNCSGRGTVPDDHRLLVCSDFTGWGVELINQLVESSDCILVLGCKFSHNGTSGYRLRLPKGRTIRVDCDPEVLSANYEVYLGILADLTDLIPALLAEFSQRPLQQNSWTGEDILTWKNLFFARRIDSLPRVVEPHMAFRMSTREFFEALQSCLPTDVIIVTDSGLHQVLARRLLAIKAARGLIVPADFQSMGFGIAAAVGAALGASDRCVVAVVGDGGLSVGGLELLTAVREHINLLVIVLSDGCFGQIRLQQLIAYGREFGTQLGRIDVRYLAQAVGASAFELEKDIIGSLRYVVGQSGVRLLEIPMKDTNKLKTAKLKRLAKELAKQIPGVNASQSIAQRIRKKLRN